MKNNLIVGRVGPVSVVFPILRCWVNLDITPAAYAVYLDFSPQEIRAGTAIPHPRVEDTDRTMPMSQALIAQQSGSPARLNLHL